MLKSINCSHFDLGWDYLNLDQIMPGFMDYGDYKTLFK